MGFALLRFGAQFRSYRVLRTCVCSVLTLHIRKTHGELTIAENYVSCCTTLNKMALDTTHCAIDSILQFETSSAFVNGKWICCFAGLRPIKQHKIFWYKYIQISLPPH